MLPVIRRTPKLIVGTIALIAFVVSAWQMYSLQETLQLWGYWPLGLLLGGWLFLLALTDGVWAKSEGENFAQWSAVLAGVLMGVTFMQPGIWEYQLVSWMPYFFAMEMSVVADSRFKRWFRTFVFAFGFNICAAWWVCNAGLLAGFLASFANALLMTIPLGFGNLAKRRLGKWWGYVALVSAWMCFEWVHHQWQLSWPWLTLGNTFAASPESVQWYEYTGTAGGTLWILLANVAAFELLFGQMGFVKSALAQRAQAASSSTTENLLDAGDESVQTPNDLKPFQRKSLLFVGCFVILPLGASTIIEIVRNGALDENARTVRVAVAQPNYEPHHEKFNFGKHPEPSQIATLMSVSGKVLTEDTDYLLFPETSFGFQGSLEERHLGRAPQLQQIRPLLRQYPSLHIVTGVDGYKVLEQGDVPGDNTMCEGNFCYNMHNAALQLGPRDTAVRDDIPYYVKSKLVPGPECFPYRHLLRPLGPLISSLGGSSVGLSVEKEREVFVNQHDSSLAVAPIICYESIYGSYCTEYVRRGANILFVVTNDGWWDDTPGYRQHRDLARLRAIETRRPLVRCANSGTSCFIDALGNYRNATNYNEQTAISDTVVPGYGLTFYARYGDWLSAMAGLVLAVCMCVLVFRGVSERQAL